MPVDVGDQHVAPGEPGLDRYVTRLSREQNNGENMYVRVLNLRYALARVSDVLAPIQPASRAVDIEVRLRATFLAQAPAVHERSSLRSNARYRLF